MRSMSMCRLAGSHDRVVRKKLREKIKSFFFFGGFEAEIPISMTSIRDFGFFPIGKMHTCVR